MRARTRIQKRLDNIPVVLVWGIVGGVIVLIFGGSALFAIIANSTNTSAWAGGLALFVVGAIIGGLVSAIENYATIVKIILESVEETRKPQPAPT